MSLFNGLIPLTNRLSRRPAPTDDERFIVPVYDIKESDDAYGLEVALPGVSRDGLDLQVDKDELVVTGRRRWRTPKDWSEIFRETDDATYRLRVELNDSVNVDKINAELEQGILRVTLPKADAVRPRRIDVN